MEGSTMKRRLFSLVCACALSGSLAMAMGVEEKEEVKNEKVEQEVKETLKTTEDEQEKVETEEVKVEAETPVEDKAKEKTSETPQTEEKETTPTDTKEEKEATPVEVDPVEDKVEEKTDAPKVEIEEPKADKEVDAPENPTPGAADSSTKLLSVSKGDGLSLRCLACLARSLEDPMCDPGARNFIQKMFFYIRQFFGAGFGRLYVACGGTDRYGFEELGQKINAITDENLQGSVCQIREGACTQDGLDALLEMLKEEKEDKGNIKTVIKAYKAELRFQVAQEQCVQDEENLVEAMNGLVKEQNERVLDVGQEFKKFLDGEFDGKQYKVELTELYSAGNAFVKKYDKKAKTLWAKKEKIKTLKSQFLKTSEEVVEG